MKKIILVVNSGSSSIKFSLFEYHNLTLEYYGEIQNILEIPILTTFTSNHSQVFKKEISTGYHAAFAELFKLFDNLLKDCDLVAVGHRIVHGGQKYLSPTIMNPEVFDDLMALVPLAPLHQPHNLEAIKIIFKINPNLLQVGCFDTSFHRTQIKLARLFAIPRSLTEEGIIRFGFHGLSYEYISSVLHEYMDIKLNNKVIVAHLGNGASLCAMSLGQSVATTMGFSVLDGLMMGTRPGSIDPGIILYLLQERKYTVAQIETLLYEQSGLLGVSNISNSVQELEKNNSTEALEALDLFCFNAAKELSALIAVLKGSDAIVFTAGIGEHSALVRKKICEWLDWLGVELDLQANFENKSIISSNKSRVLVAVIPTNEEYMIAKHTKNFIKLE